MPPRATQSIHLQSFTAVVMLALCLLSVPSPAQVPEPPQSAQITTVGVGVGIDIDRAAKKIDALYLAPQATLHYEGQFLQEVLTTPTRFVAKVSSEAGGTFAEGDFSADGFTIRLGDVEIDSTKTITEAQAEAIAAFGKTAQAESLRKLVQTLSVETAPEDKHYVVALSALVMIADSGNGAPAQAGNDCLGCCGPGCWGCTGCYTAACRAHDQCVAAHGHLKCLLGLIPAIGSLIRECLLNPVWWLA